MANHSGVLPLASPSKLCLLVFGLLAATGCQSIRSTLTPAGALVQWTTRWARPVVAVTPAPDPTRLATESPAPSPELHTSMARLLEHAEQDGGAEVHYQKSLDLEPDNLDAQLGYGRLLARTGREEEAAAWFEKSCQEHPENAAVHNDLGLCYAQCGRKEDALAPLSQAVELQPDRVLYRNNIAHVLLELGRREEALGQLATVHPPAVAHYNMGYLLRTNGEQKQAAIHFRQALAFDPEFESAQIWSSHLATERVVQHTTVREDLLVRRQAGYGTLD